MAGALCATRPAADFQRSRVGGERAGDDLYQRRLSCAVLTDQGMDFSLEQLEGNVVQRLDAREGFADRGCSEKRDTHRLAQKRVLQPPIHGDDVTGGFGALVACEPNDSTGAILREDRFACQSPLGVEIGQLGSQLLG